MKKCVALLLVLTLSTGCISFRSGSLPPIAKLDTEIEAHYVKRDVSFSVSYYQQVGDEIIISKKQLQDTIKKSFQKSQLFNRIYLTTFSDKSNYHYHFDLKITGTSPVDQYNIGLSSGYTLLTIPFWMNFYIDTTMYLFVDGKEVYSATTTDRVTDLIWLPLVVTWIFANHATMGSYIRKHSLEYFINEIKQNHLYSIPTYNPTKNGLPRNLEFLDNELEQIEDNDNNLDVAQNE